jgi:hypothetical protein
MRTVPRVHVLQHRRQASEQISSQITEFGARREPIINDAADDDGALEKVCTLTKEGATEGER